MTIKFDSLTELAGIVHENSQAHGWWDEPRNLLEIVALWHSELSEAVEEYRDGNPAEYDGEGGKPEGIAVELVDCIIRILDYLGYTEIDVDAVMQRKMAYNKTRPYKHGKKC